MKETYMVVVGEGDDAFSILFEDYDSAANEAQAYRDQGMKTRIEYGNKI